MAAPARVPAPPGVREAARTTADVLDAADTTAANKLATRPYPAGAAIAVGPGLLPANVEEVYRVATLLANTEFVPKGFRGRDNDVFAAILFGLDLRLPPMQSLQTIAVINGRPSVYGDGLLAIVYSLPNYVDHDEYYEVDGVRKEHVTAADLRKDTTCAVCVFTRLKRSKPVTRSFSVENAKTANLWTKDGPWKQYPDRMLMFRARGFAARDAFPDGLRGIITSEEANDIPGEVVASDIIQPQRVSATGDGAPSNGIGSPGTAAASPATGAAAAPSLLPDGLDRIVKQERRESDGKAFWIVRTERGLEAMTYLGKDAIGACLERAAREHLTVKLATKDGANGRTILLDVAIVDGTTGEQS